MSGVILIFVLMLFPLAFRQVDDPPQFDKLLYISRNDTLPYRFLKPADPRARKTFPLVIFLHGAGERGTDNESQIEYIEELFLDPGNRSKFPCYVVAPQCPEKMLWATHGRDGNRLVIKKEPTLPMRLLIQLLDTIEKEYPIDMSRIYVTGLSMGGYGTWDLIARFPDRFAAAVPICGGGDPQTAPLIKNIPVWAFHGALDNVVFPSNSRTMIKALQDTGAKPGYTEYPDVAHDSWTHAYREPALMPWLFSHSLENNVVVK